MSMTEGNGNGNAQSNPVQSLPISDWKNSRLKVGWHIRNNRGQVGVITWASGGCLMYRLGTRKLGNH
jgi:hypothetical protein